MIGERTTRNEWERGKRKRRRYEPGRGKHRSRKGEGKGIEKKEMSNVKKEKVNGRIKK